MWPSEETTWPILGASITVEHDLLHDDDGLLASQARGSDMFHNFFFRMSKSDVEHLLTMDGLHIAKQDTELCNLFLYLLQLSFFHLQCTGEVSPCVCSLDLILVIHICWIP